MMDSSLGVKGGRCFNPPFSSFPHILPNLVDLQMDDQLDWAYQNRSVRPTKDGRSRGPISPHLQFHHPGLRPHVPMAAFLLQEDDVPDS